jgi:hypothetical protein
MCGFPPRREHHAHAIIKLKNGAKIQKNCSTCILIVRNMRLRTLSETICGELCPELIILLTVIVVKKKYKGPMFCSDYKTLA